MEQKCKNCQYYKADLGECWRYPPRQIKKPDQWCGEFDNGKNWIVNPKTRKLEETKVNKIKKKK